MSAAAVLAAEGRRDGGGAVDPRFGPAGECGGDRLTDAWTARRRHEA
ncbi:hypothetical protein AB5J52_35475 [Streptomyces sp. R39]|uniref:Uncharacterized protein n=1 Tax=Streptomyces sp. R39 TaxID=3238631 RepID=A0AB39QX31_9ACTN